MLVLLKCWPTTATPSSTAGRGGPAVRCWWRNTKDSAPPLRPIFFNRKRSLQCKQLIQVSWVGLGVSSSDHSPKSLLLKAFYGYHAPSPPLAPGVGPARQEPFPEMGQAKGRLRGWNGRGKVYL
jgi:hypothetical protein